MKHAQFVVLAALGMSMLPSAFADSGLSINESDPRTGSHIRREIAHSRTLPLNKRYDELTPEQKAHLATQYESMGEGDEPPFPRDGMSAIVKPLAQAQQKLAVRGRLELLVRVNAEGQATAVSRLGAPIDEEMTTVAAKVLMLTDYKPALCKGVPCAQEFPFSMEFEVKL